MSIHVRYSMKIFLLDLRKSDFGCVGVCYQKANGKNSNKKIENKNLKQNDCLNTDCRSMKENHTDE